MATDKIRFTISIDEEVYKQMEDFRFEERYNTMTKATEALLKKGLLAYHAEQNAILEQEPENMITAKEAFGEGV